MSMNFARFSPQPPAYDLSNHHNYTCLSQYAEQWILNESMLEVVKIVNHLLGCFDLFSYAVYVRVLHRESLIENNYN